MKKRYLFLTAVSVLIQQTAWGQTASPMKNFPAPNVASLGVYGQMPVSLYTGQPDISIPLFEFKEGPITIPIVLSYNLSSVKPNKSSSWVGLGWNLSCGGFISRNVRGIMDEKKFADNQNNGYAPGFYAHRNKITEITNTEQLIDKTYFFHPNTQNENYYELTADEFSFNFCGYSGYFYLNQDGGWTVISDHKIKVEFDEQTGFTSYNGLHSKIRHDKQWPNKKYCARFFNKFTLVTPDGIRYTFGGKDATEYSISYFRRSSSDLIPTTWHLTEILSPDGYSVNLTYVAGNPTCEIKYSPVTTYLDWVVCNQGYNPHTTGYAAFSGYLLFPVYLTKIESINLNNEPFVTIDFISKLDTGSSEKIPKSRLARNYSADYNPFDGPPQNDEEYTSLLEYAFTIEALNNVELKRTELYNNVFFSKYLHAISLSVGEDFAKTYYFGYDNMNRRLLSFITERKGEYEEINYEGGGIIIPPLPFGQNPIDYKFEYNITSGQRMPKNSFANEDHWGYWNGGDISITATAEYINSYNRSPSFNHAKAETLKKIIYPTGGYTEFEYELNSWAKCVSANFTSLENDNRSGAGLRIKSITSYNDNNVFAFKKKYYYTKNTSPSTSNSSGILKNRHEYNVYFEFNDSFYKYFIIGNKKNDVVASIEIIQTNPFVAHGTNNNSPVVGYSSVIEETVDNNSNSQGYIRYTFTNYDEDIWGNTHFDEKFDYSVVAGDVYFNQFSSKAQERGKTTSMVFYDASNNPKKSVKYKYKKDLETNNYLKTIHQELLFLCSHASALQFTRLSSVFKTYFYSYLLEKEIHETYDGNNILQKETTYEYNPHKLISKTTETNSDGNIYETKNIYNSDLANSSNPPIYSNMVNRHIYNKLVEETINKKNTPEKVIKSTNIEYEQTFFKPYQIYSLVTTPPVLPNAVTGLRPGNLNYVLENEFIYSYYTDVPIAIIDKRNDVSTVYFWSYNRQYPVAVIENATYDEVASAILEIPYGFLDFEWFLPSANKPDDEDLKNINDLRNTSLIEKANITTYSFIPFVGMTSMTDYRGITTYYKYDDFGRLSEVKTGQKNAPDDLNENEKIEGKYSYHYATAPSLITSYSVSGRTVTINYTGCSNLINSVSIQYQYISGSYCSGLLNNRTCSGTDSFNLPTCDGWYNIKIMLHSNSGVISDSINIYVP
ncbi:MAG: hypothetical protein FWC41_04665 [Firmicutes bacterium]|nr:hypothetical protein [Bacillota bacterium]